MKNLSKILAMTLLVSVFAIVAVSSLFATSTVQIPTSQATFNGETGIRWNQGLDVFEVFNDVGVSYIGSGKSFNALGEPDGTGSVAASAGARYHIMQDIVYSIGNPIFSDYQSGARATLTSTALVNGRGFTLKNFPIANGTALFSANAGVIQNLNLVSPTFVSADTNSSVGIIALENTGTIEDCTVSGSFLSADYGFGAISYSGAGIIRNCTNRVSITTSAELAGGIMADASGAKISNCTNYGDIKAASFAGGAAATTSSGEALSNRNYAKIEANYAGGILGTRVGSMPIQDNKNYGTITGTSVAAGILAGNALSPDTKIASNFNSGNLLNAAKMAQIYLGEPKSTETGGTDGTGGTGGTGSGTTVKPKDPTDATEVGYVAEYVHDGTLLTNGIKYHESGVFLITRSIGFSYINSTDYINTDGEISESGICAKPSVVKKFYIANDIEYSESSGFGSTITLAADTLVDGQGFTLNSFPIKNSGDRSALFATINSGAIVRNINLVITSPNLTGNAGGFALKNNGTIANCSISGQSVSTANGFGAIAYQANPGIIRNCISSVSITCTADALRVIGGIVGIISAMNNDAAYVVDCTVSRGVVITIGGGNRAGGIVGRFDLAGQGMVASKFGVFYTVGSAIIGCVSYARFVAERPGEDMANVTAVGGIVGSNTPESNANRVSILYCAVLWGGGDVTFYLGRHNVFGGGIVGRLSGTTSINLYLFAVSSVNYAYGPYSGSNNSSFGSDIGLIYSISSECQIKSFGENLHFGMVAGDKEYSGVYVGWTNLVAKFVFEELNKCNALDLWDAVFRYYV